MLRLGANVKLHQLCSEKTKCRGLGSKVWVTMQMESEEQGEKMVECGE